MLKARIATALILLGVFLSALFMLPTRQFALLIGAVVAIGAFEWSGLAKAKGWIRYAYAAFCTVAFALVVWGIQAINPVLPGLAAFYGVSTIFWLVAVPIWFYRGVRLGSLGQALPVGVLVIVPAGLAIVSMHSIDPSALLMLLVLVWIADTAAFFAGRAFGRHKLAPTISPGKTWEGAAGAVLATLIYAIICAGSWPYLGTAVQNLGWVPYLAVSGLLCVVSILGDLFESSVKRHAAVKDSGTLLPGHGGVLDRIDSITSTLPVAAFLFYLVAEGK